MTAENTPADGLEPVPGQEPKPDSQPSGDSPDFVTREDFKVLQGLVQGLQSDKDKAISNMHKRQDDFETTLKEYADLTGQKLDPNALLQMKVDRLTQAQTSPEPTQPQPSGQPAQAAPASVDVVGLLKSLDLDANDNAVLQITSRHISNPEAMKAALVDHKVARSTAPAASPASVAAPAGGGAPPESQDEKVERLNILYRDPVKNREAIEQLTKELDQSGAYTVG